MARRRFFVDRVRAGEAEILGDDAYHLTRVLRVETGQRFELSDNQNVYLAEVRSARKDLVSFAVLETLAAPPPGGGVHLYASLIRFERFELMLEKATELGVDRIVPVLAERSEKGLERAAEKRMPRWLRVVREASEQSRRARLPEIADVLTLAQVLSTAAGLLLDEDAAAPPLLSVLDDGGGASLIVGPEGGWSDRERAAFRSAGWRAGSLGATILKAETAAVAAIAVVNAWNATRKRPSRSPDASLPESL